MTRTALLLAAALGALGLAAPGARAQNDITPPGPADPPPPDADRRVELDLSELPAGLALGVRSALTHRTQVSIPVVVIAPDAASYVRAIGGWRGVSRYPVLIDDGTHRSAERIARFVRAYEPERVVRLDPASEPTEPEPEAGDPPDAGGSLVMGGAEPARGDEGGLIEPLPAPGPELEQRLGRAWADAMDVGHHVMTSAQALALMRAAGYAPPGVVVMDTSDPAWAGGLALAAGRLCPMLFVDGVGSGIDGVVSHDQADELASAIEAGVDALGFAWDREHDDIDALTLAMNTPAKIRYRHAGDREHLATTDRLGRSGPRGEGARWAWCGQVHGSASESSWRAMCALFLPIESAWVFDGYPAGDPWSRFDGSAAADELRESGVSARVHDLPDNADFNWRQAASRGVSADLILVNSKGLPNFFQMNPGDLAPGDAPILDRPAALHMVHSFAFQRPGNERTVGGRFLAHGVYAAFGSVEEPYLHAFAPTPMFARRLRAGYAWGAAGRLDTGPPWRIAVFGDPLMTLVKDPARGEPGLGLQEIEALAMEDLDHARAAAVRAEDYAAALRLLVMAGEDADAARLAAALLGQAPEKLGPEASPYALGALFREGQHERAIAAFERLDDEGRRDPVNADTMWNSARTLLAASADDGLVGVLDANWREGQLAGDAIEVSTHVRRISGIDAARTYLGLAKDRMPSSRAREKIDRAIRRLDR